MPVCVEILLPARANDNVFEYEDPGNKELTDITKIRRKVYLPKKMIEKPITKTRFNTLPTACVRGATLSRVFVAN